MIVGRVRGEGGGTVQLWPRSSSVLSRLGVCARKNLAEAVQEKVRMVDEKLWEGGATLA